jgi:hypothetical protein
MKQKGNLARAEMNVARRMWGSMGSEKMKELQNLVERHKLSISLGDVLLLADRWYVTHSGLLRCAHRHRCSGIKTTLEPRFSDPTVNRWVFRATVYGPNRSKSFVGYGDADPLNISPVVRGAEMRIAETRAVNRALRKAYGIGICSVDELSSSSGPSERSSAPARPAAGSHASNGASNGQPRLRDRLCLLIRQHNLDSGLVKAYAADFCGTQSLNGASRDLVESFISHLAAAAKENRDSLVCKLNSYARTQELKS